MVTVLRVTRSPVRQFLMGVAGLVLILAAVDIVWLHRLAGPPQTNDDGTLTSKGIVQRRGDILWGTVLLVGGGVVVAVAATGLALGRPVVELTDEELRLRLGGPLRNGGPLGTVGIPWEEVIAVRSATHDSDAWPRSRVLVVEVSDPSRLPVDPWGAAWQGDAIHVDGDSWQVPPEEVAMRAQMLIQRSGRSRAVRDDAIRDDAIRDGTIRDGTIREDRGPPR